MRFAFCCCLALLWIHFVIESMSTTMAQNVMPNWATSFYVLFVVVALCVVVFVVIVKVVFVATVFVSR